MQRKPSRAVILREPGGWESVKLVFRPTIKPALALGIRFGATPSRIPNHAYRTGDIVRAKRNKLHRTDLTIRTVKSSSLDTSPSTTLRFVGAIMSGDICKTTKPN